MVQNKKRKSWDIELGGVKHTDILLMTKHLAMSLRSGLTIVDGLEMIYEQASGRLKSIVQEIITLVQSGQPFYKALERYPKYFSPLYVNLVRTGEYAGTLEENLNHLAEYLRKIYELKKKVKSAMIYPLFVLFTVVGLSFAIALFVFPNIIPLFKTLDIELPITTRILLFVAELFSKHGFSISLGTVLFFAGAGFVLRLNLIKPALHRLFLILPIVQPIVKNMNNARLSHTLGMLLKSGVPVDMSLQITFESTENRVYRHAIKAVISEVQKGKTLAAALQYYKDIFPPLTTRMIAMGEKTGSLDATLNYLSEFYENEVDSVMKNLSNILEPVLLIVIGFIVAIVVVAILGPIYQVTGSIKK